MSFKTRPAHQDDCAGVSRLKSGLKGRRDPSRYCANLRPEWLIENAYLTLVATDSKTEQVVGFLAICKEATHRDSSPAGDETDEKSEWLNIEMATLGCDPEQTWYIKALYIGSKHSREVTECLIRSAFHHLTAMESLLWATPGALPAEEMKGVLRSFSVLAESEIEGLCVYSASRDKHLPHLAVRKAVVDDHDDLLPVLERGAQRFPAFAQLPESVSPTSEFALARVIDDQDDRNLVLIAQDGGRMVGMLVCTASLDLGVVRKSFDLHAYDNLLPPEVYEAQVELVRNEVLDRKREAAEAERQARIDRRNQERLEENERRRLLKEEFVRKYEEEYAQKVAAEEEALKAAAKKKGKRAPMAEPMPKVPPPPKIPDEMRDLGMDTHVEPEVVVETTEEEVRAAMLASEDPRQPAASTGEQLCFAAVVYCLDERCESLWPDLMVKAFEHFQTKDYCLVMLPHDSKVPPMLRDFARVPSVPGSKFPEQLYIFHRFGLIRDFEVRLATAEDAADVEELTAGMSNQQEVLQSFQSTLEQESAVVALVQNRVVALATFIPGVNLELLQGNFDLGSRIEMGEIAEETHAEVDMIVINPIFAHRKYDLLMNCLLSLPASVLFYALPPGTEKPEVLAAFAQVPGRHKADTGDSEGFALYCFTRRLCHARREVINSQVVVVGASECGISAIEQLLCSTELEFTSITLVAPGGITVGGAGSSYSSQDVSRIGLDAQVDVVDGEMVGLDREERVIYLMDGTAISYEALVLTAGLQDQSLKKLNRGAELNAPVVTLEELISELEEPFAQSLTNCIVYGATMEAYQAMEVLVGRGCSMQYITHVIPPEGHVGPSFAVPKLTKAIGVDLPDTEVMTLVDLQGNDDGELVDATFAFVSAETMENVTTTRSVQLLVMADVKDVDIMLFECINGASLVYDGRIVVDGAFRTNDPSIFAAGTVARFSRSLALDVFQEYYNSTEIGARLAESVCAVFGAGELRPDELPRLGAARVAGTDLPGGGSVVYVGTPAAIAHPRLEPPLEGRRVSTNTENGYCHLVFDENQVVQSFVYAGPHQINGAKYQGLVGMSASYLNDIIAKHEAGLVTDLLDFLNEPWAKLYQHDEFFTIRTELLASAAPFFDAKGNNDAIKSMTIDVLLAFVRSHIAELPGYHLPTSAFK